MAAGSPTRKSYLVECYWPGLTEARAVRSARRAAEVAAGLSAEGTEVRYRTAFIVPDDEVALCLFEAASAADVAEVCRRAELPCDRILRVAELSAEVGGPRTARKPGSVPARAGGDHLSWTPVARRLQRPLPEG